jgi:hypothetical protein
MTPALGSIFRAMVFFNEADKLESSSILIYLPLQMGLYTQNVWREAGVIKRVCQTKEGN